VSKVKPVVKLHSGLATQAVMLAISSTVQKRPIGMRRRRPSMKSGVISLNRSVSVMAGASALTVTPLPASSLARLLVSAITPALAAL
jgi:hypothetical protein